MAGDVKVAVIGGAISSSATGTADFTKSGFGTVKACIILLTPDGTDNTSVFVEGAVSIGFSDFSSQFCITHQDEDASAKVDCDALKSNTKSYIILAANATVDIDGTASAITDGVRLTNTTNDFLFGSFATVIMFGGADLAISLQSSAINASQDGTATITHSGFTDGNDKLIFFIGSDISGEDSASSGINNSFGVCHATGSDAGGWTFVQRCMGWASDHNATTGTPSGIISTEHVLDMITEAGTEDWALEVTALDHSPATITVTTRDNGAGSGMEVYSLALDLDDRSAKVGSVDGPTATGDWAPSVSLGFTPQYVGLGLSAASGYDSIAGSFGAVMGISSNTGSGEETCHSWYNEDNALDTVTNNLFRSRAIDLRNDDVTIIRTDASHSSLASGGWTYTVNTENETTARKWFYWTIEEAADGGVTTKTLVATTIGVATLGPNSIFKTLALTTVGALNLNRGIFKTLEATSTGTPTLEKIKLALKTLTATAVGIANMTRIPMLTLRAQASGEATLGRRIFKILTATVTGAGSLGRLVFKTLTATTVGIAAVEIFKMVTRTLVATVAGVATLSRKLIASRLLAATAVGTATLRKAIFKTLKATAVGIGAVVADSLASLTKLTLSALTAGIATLSRQATHFRPLIAIAVGLPNLKRTTFKTLSATAVGLVNIDPVKLVMRTLTATVSGVATLGRLVGKGLNATTVGQAALSRTATFLRTVTATTTGVASLGRTTFKMFSASALGVASVAVNQITTVAVQITLSAVASGVATLNTLYVQFFAPFTGGSGLGILDRTQTRWKRRARTWKARR